jgi:hypothetical protein
MLLIAVTFLSYLNIIPITKTEIASYSLMIFGLSYFYSSNLKQYQVGIFFGAALFLIGTIVFVFSKFEILNFGNVFVPSALIIIGLSLFISTLLTRASTIASLFSALSLFAGVWLLIYRGTGNVDLYLSAVYALFKSYWVIILLFAGIIILTARDFKKNNNE